MVSLLQASCKICTFLNIFTELLARLETALAYGSMLQCLIKHLFDVHSNVNMYALKQVNWSTGYVVNYLATSKRKRIDHPP